MLKRLPFKWDIWIDFDKISAVHDDVKNKKMFVVVDGQKLELCGETYRACGIYIRERLAGKTLEELDKIYG